MLSLIGTIVSFKDTPNINHFFVLNANTNEQIPKIGQFVETTTEEGILIGIITNITKTNRYFSQMETLADYQRQGFGIESIFPADLWEYTLIEAKTIAVYTKDAVLSPNIPPAPGNKVFLATEDILKKVLGFVDDGLFIGHLKTQNIKVKLDMNRLLRKHLAVLAMSGAGKSYTVSVIIEELLKRKINQGRITTVLFDVHGEYLTFSDSEYSRSKQVIIVDGSAIQFDTSKIPLTMYSRALPEMSLIQLRELKRIMGRHFEKQTFSLKDIIDAISQDEEINLRTKDALISWLYELETLHLFEKEEYPKWNNLMKPGKLVIINLGNIISLKKKQMILMYVASRLFSLRRKNIIPPVFLIVEEAHQFCPEARQELAISKSIIETIAREGRKFYTFLCLISQRPLRLSTTALSQCNSQIILRITNPYDLKHIASSNEAIDSNVLDIITRLTPGEALIVGEATNYPIFVNIRKHELPEIKFDKSIEEISRLFEKSS